MNIILFDDKSVDDLLPLTYTRPLAEIRIGILTIREKWEYLFNSGSITSTITHGYLQEKFPLIIAPDNLLINGSVCPSPEHLKEISKLEKGQQLVYEDYVIAICISGEALEEMLGRSTVKPLKLQIEQTDYLKIRSEYRNIKIRNLWDIFVKNAEALTMDFQTITKERKSGKISSENHINRAENVFIEEGAKICCSMINASSGPVYIGKDAEIMEGCLIRGPFALCEGSILKMGAKIYGPTTIGPNCKIGGEINNSVIFGYSNKAHDGFLGNSVIGEWCNLGADTNTSNLKNNYGEVDIWSHALHSNIKTGLQFCGLIIADHGKTGINTMLNTGTVIGVNANVFGAGFPPKFIPSFSWGGAEGLTEYSIEKAIEVAARVYQRRNLIFDIENQKILTEIFKISAEHRRVTY